METDLTLVAAYFKEMLHMFFTLHCVVCHNLRTILDLYAKFP